MTYRIRSRSRREMRGFVFVAGEVARSRYAWRIFVGRFGSVFPGGASSVTARKQPDEVIGWSERERERESGEI